MAGFAEGVGFVVGGPVRGNVEEASSYSADADPQQLPNDVGPVRDRPQHAAMATCLRAGGESQEVLVASVAGFALDGLRGLQTTSIKLVTEANFLCLGK